MYDIDKSDTIVCHTRAQSMYNYRKYNDAIFFQRFANTQPTRSKNFATEYTLHTSENPNIYICNDAINSRGGNAIPCQNARLCPGFKCFTEYHMDEYLLTPCKTNTWKNHVECDNSKCCSVHHQMYDNWTKRK